VQTRAEGHHAAQWRDLIGRPLWGRDPTEMAKIADKEGSRRAVSLFSKFPAAGHPAGTSPARSIRWAAGWRRTKGACGLRVMIRARPTRDGREHCVRPTENSSGSVSWNSARFNQRLGKRDNWRYRMVSFRSGAERGFSG